MPMVLGEVFFLVWRCAAKFVAHARSQDGLNCGREDDLAFVLCYYGIICSDPGELEDGHFSFHFDGWTIGMWGIFT